jgi:hypothetical protein
MNRYAPITNRFDSFTKCFAGDTLLNPQISLMNADFLDIYPLRLRHPE